MLKYSSSSVFSIFFAILGITAGVFLVLKGPQIFSKANKDTDNQYANIRSVTWYDSTSGPRQSNKNLGIALPKIKDAGFNTVWLVNQWSYFDPDPLNTPRIYNETSFNQLKFTLELLRKNNMKAIIGLNYLGEGWSPKGIDACNWINNPTMYNSFVTYSSEFLKRISDYQDMVYILVFTENAIPCEFSQNLYEASNAKMLASQLRSTLGNFPNQLPADIRSKYRIGYHDYALINLGWSGGDSPIANPNPFDFVSMVGYSLDDTNFEFGSESYIRATLTDRLGNFLSTVPNVPIIMGEYGTSSCGGKDDNQARVIGIQTSWALENKLGFNLWGWKNQGSTECTNGTNGGFAITNTDGSAKPAAGTIKNILTAPQTPKPTPVIKTSGVNQNFNPWAVYVTGDNLVFADHARLFDSGKQWGEDILIFISADKSFASFSLPSNTPPSKCNIGKSCDISLALLSNGQLSNTIKFSLPPLAQVTPTVASTTPTPAVQVKINSAGLNTSYSPWAVWITGNNIANDKFKVKLTDKNSQWGELITISIAADKSFISFNLPSNIPPSGCNLNGSCSIGITLVDSAGAVSDTYTLLLPKAQ